MSSRCERLVCVWENRHLGDTRPLHRFSSPGFSRLAAPLRSLPGSNASRHSVFYCVHVEETFIINLDHDSSPSLGDTLALPPSYFPVSSVGSSSSKRHTVDGKASWKSFIRRTRRRRGSITVGNPTTWTASSCLPRRRRRKMTGDGCAGDKCENRCLWIINYT